LSGEGSSFEQTVAIRREIPRLVRELRARSFLDAPCGDFNWMRHVDLGVELYRGVDIVEDLVADNRARFGGPGREFLCRDLIRDALPAADIVLCRDCLGHLTFEQAKALLRNVKRSGSRYLLVTTFADRRENVDLFGRDLWRTLNLERPPFNLPKPLRVIDERCTQGGGAYADKCLGLWRLDDVTLERR
jgi:SAM-dependent methyltransferase